MRKTVNYLAGHTGDPSKPRAFDQQTLESANELRIDRDTMKGCGLSSCDEGFSGATSAVLLIVWIRTGV